MAGSPPCLPARSKSCRTPPLPADRAAIRPSTAASAGSGGGLQDLLRAGVELGFGDVALLDEISGNAAEPFFIVAELEIVERIERLRALAQVRPGPHGVELARRRRQRQLRAQCHHRHVNAEDAFLPRLDEHPLLERHRAEAFETPKIVLQFHGISLVIGVDVAVAPPSPPVSFAFFYDHT